MKGRRKHVGDEVKNKIIFRRHFQQHEKILHKSQKL